MFHIVFLIFFIFQRDLDHRNKHTNENSTVDEQECCNCEVSNLNGYTGAMHSTPKGILCDECFVYWQKSGLMRPELYPSKSSVKKIKRPPKNISLDLDSILNMHAYDHQSNSNTDQNNVRDPIDKLEDEIHQELAKIQAHNQAIGQLTIEARQDIESMRIPFLTSSTSPFLINNSNANGLQPTSTWSTEEILLAIQAFGKYGKDFDAVARIIGSSKTVADVESFFLECRERYQLDSVIEISAPKPMTNNNNQRKQQNSNEIVFVN